jgi:hypothetical protein
MVSSAPVSIRASLQARGIRRAEIYHRARLHTLRRHLELNVITKVHRVGKKMLTVLYRFGGHAPNCCRYLVVSNIALETCRLSELMPSS